MAERRALIIASGEYEHEGLRRLNSPAADADALAAVLGDPRIGGFEVEVVRDQPAHDIQARVEDLFSEARPDDVLLVHFSCHGLKSEQGELFFAARNTKPNRLASTAVSADFVQRCVRSSRSRSIVLFLDCCFGGAFGQGVAVRAAGDVNVLDSFPAGRLGGGRGRAVISASNAVEYAFEGDALVDDAAVAPSLFTSAVVQGLVTGEADRDEDGWVSLNELYDYVFDKVREASSNQTPSRDIEMQGELYLARSSRRRVRPSPVPAELAAAAADQNMFSRVGAVAELRVRLLGDNLPVAVGARDLLVRIAADDIEFVAQKAQAALDDARLVVSEAVVAFGEVVRGTTAARRVALSGPPVAVAVTVAGSESWLRVTAHEGWVDVELDTQEALPRSGAITLAGPGGELVVPVTAEVVTRRRRGGLPKQSASKQSASKQPAPGPVASTPPAPAPVASPPQQSAPGQPVPKPVTPTPVEAARAAASTAPAAARVTALAGPGRPGPATGVVLAGLVIIVASAFLPWFDEQLKLTDLSWGTLVNGTFLPQWWLTLAVLVAAGALLVADRWIPVAMGLAGGAGFTAFWLSLFAAGSPSDVLFGDFVYLAGAVVVLGGVSLWIWTVRGAPAVGMSSRPLTLVGSVLIVFALLPQIGPNQVTFSVLYCVAVLAISAAVLMPERISEPLRIAVLAGVTAHGAVAVGAAINYLALFRSSEGARITDPTGRIALGALIAVGLWIGLHRPAPSDRT